MTRNTGRAQCANTVDPCNKVEGRLKAEAQAAVEAAENAA
jgi:hypothetical protein